MNPVTANAVSEINAAIRALPPSPAPRVVQHGILARLAPPVAAAYRDAGFTVATHTERTEAGTEIVVLTIGVEDGMALP